jgi:hypothetical protein
VYQGKRWAKNLAPFWTQPTSGLLPLMRKNGTEQPPSLAEELAEMEAELAAAVRSWRQAMRL